MQVEILERPANTTAKLTFSANENVTTEGGSLIAMSGGIDIETTTHKKGKRGVGKALKRMLSGESLFLNHYSSRQDGAELYISPTLSGDIMQRKISHETLVVQGSSFLAHWGDIDMDMKWQGMKGLFSGEGLFWLKFSGQGEVLLNSFGTIYEVDVKDEMIVDSGHIVAFEDSLQYKISKVGKSWMSSFLGGEGLVCRFTGQGKVWCQTHSPRSFGMTLGPMLRPAS